MTNKDTAQAALDRIERKADMLRLDSKMRNRRNLVQHMEEIIMEEIIQLTKMARRNIGETDASE